METNYPNEGAVPNMPPFKMGPWLGPLIILLLLLTATGTLFYQVDQDEAGVVQRFGKYMRTTGPGLHMKLPFGIEMARRVKVTHIFKEEFGFRTVMAGVRTIYAGREGMTEELNGSRQGNSSRAGGGDPFIDESMMLTGDLNVAVVEWIVQYTIKDPVAFLFHVRDARETIRNMSEAAMRLIVGDHIINDVLTAGREQIQGEAEKMLQEVLDSYGAGIDIRNVILQDVTPPNEVKPSFNQVNEARQEKEKLINQAWEEYNRVIPRAKGEAEQQLRGAEGYALERINRAQGDAERFLLSWEAYRVAPDVTRRRLYLETMQAVLPRFRDKWIMDETQKGLLPFLDLTRKEAEAPS